MSPSWLYCIAIYPYNLACRLVSLFYLIVCVHVLNIFRPQEQQQQPCGITSVRIVGSAAVPATNRQRPATVGNTNAGMAANSSNIVGNMLPQHAPISYYTHSAPQTSYFNDVLHPMQVLTVFSNTSNNNQYI